MKASYLSALLVACFTLSACGESNPFKFQSDPLASEYSGLKSYDTPAESAQIKPEISMVSEGWPENKVDYGTFFTFKVEVNDPASSQNSPPLLSEPEFNSTPDSATLNGATAIECKVAPRSTGHGKWQFECTFNTKDLADVSQYLKSEKILNANFTFSATSQRSGLSTGSVTASVPVQFVKVLAAGKGSL